MTREEVIDLLKKDKSQRGKCFVSDALDIAINVLEQEYDIDKIKAEIKHRSEHFINENGELDYTWRRFNINDAVKQSILHARTGTKNRRRSKQCA